MKHKILIINILLTIIMGILILPRSVHAQTNDHQLSGMVVDSVTHKIPGYITVNLKASNAPVKVMVTRADGSFLFGGLKPLQYTVTFSSIGYQTKSIRVTVTDSIKKYNLGAILLHSQTKQLKEVAITADKPLIKQEVDRISYDLQADPDSKISSVLEMLRKVPFVTVDGDDNIKLKGNADFKIFINGKPSGMLANNPKDVLRSIPASTIQRIEVITTVPAKYDAEGLGGIINIITNKKIVDGYNGSANINSHFPGGAGVGTSFTFKEGKLGVSGFGGASIDGSPLTTSLNTRTTSGSNPTSLVQQGTTKPNVRNGYFGTEISYEIDSLNLISGQFNGNGYHSYGNRNQTSLLTGPMGILQAYNLANAQNGTGNGFDGSLNYQLGFKSNKLKLLTFSYRYSDYKSTTDNDLLISDRINYNTPNYNQDNHVDALEQTIQIDFVEPLKKWNMEAGVKAIFRDNRSDFQYNEYSALTNQFELNDTLSNKFNSTQNIFAAYNTWQYSGKNWGIKAGARIEQTITDADFISTATSIHQSYLNVIPSLAFNLNFKDNSGINFGFTQRLKRPNIYKLNPYVDRSNPNFESTGNPDLRRVVLNDIQLGYHINKKASLNIAAVYDFGKGLDLTVSNFDPATNITYSTYKNEGVASGIGGFVNFNYPITKKWNFSLNTNLMHFELTGDVDGVLQTSKFWTFSLFSSTGYSFDKGWRVAANLSINGRNPTGLQGSSKGFVSTTLSVSKQLIKNKLSISGSVNNPFTKYRYNEADTYGINFAQSMINQSYFRTVNCSLNYNFGKLKDGVKKTRRSINNDDK